MTESESRQAAGASVSSAEAPDPIRREELYDRVWQEPLLRIAERLGVSSTYLARVCDALRVPRPPNGYWPQLEFGKAPPRPPLPQARPGDLTEWMPGSSITASHSPAPRTKPRPAAPARPRAARPVPRKPVAERHELLDGVAPLFSKTRDSDNGLLRPFKRLLADVLTSQAQLDAALDTANTLFQAFESKGHRVAIATPGSNMRRADVDEREVRPKDHYRSSPWSPDRPTIVHIGQTPIGLTLFETTAVVETMYVGDSKYVPVAVLTAAEVRRHERLGHWTTRRERTSGRFCLQAYCPTWLVKWTKQWKGTSAAELASMARSIVQELEADAPVLHRLVADAREKAEAERRRWEEEARLRREAEERARQEKLRQDSREDLLAAIDAWDQARRLHEWVALVERNAQRLPEQERSEILGRLAKARELIGRVDAVEVLKQWKAPEERNL